jgi:hypothetical protein
MPLSYRKRIYRRTKRILWGPTEVIAALVGLAVIFNRPVMEFIVRVWQGLPWWVGALILAGLLLYAIGRASYEEYREVEQERDALRARVKELEGQSTPRPLSEIKGSCVHISEDMSDFVKRRQESEPGFDIFQERKHAKTDDELNRVIERENEARRQHEAETLRLYHERYKDRVMGIYHELNPGYWFGGDDREYFENPKDTDDIETVAWILKTVAGRM